MHRKGSLASAFCLAAYGLFLFGAGGTGASAQEAALAPLDRISNAGTPHSLGLGVPVTKAPSTQWEEVQQDFDAALVSPVPAEDGSDRPAGSLSELVENYSGMGKLSSELRCLAGAIYFEARGEPLAGQLAVGQVIKNRVESGKFPSSYCGVVHQRSQFSFVKGGRMPAIRESSAAWARARAIARIADGGKWDSPVGDALFFHAKYVKPGWKLTRVAQVSTHIFYR